MDLKITEKKEEPLLSRIKLIGEIGFEGATPSYEEVKKKIVSSLNCDEKLTVIKNIYTKFGIRKADFLAYIYKNEEAMKKIEPKQKEKKEAKVTKEPAKESEKVSKEKPEGKKEQAEEKKKEEKPEKKEEQK
jgi:ribosomal protein S24E